MDELGMRQDEHVYYLHHVKRDQWWRVKTTPDNLAWYANDGWECRTLEEYRAASVARKASRVRSWIVRLEPSIAQQVEALAEYHGWTPQETVVYIVRNHFRATKRESK